MGLRGKRFVGKLPAMVMAAAILVSSSLSVLAGTNAASITISDSGQAGAKYEAYRLMDLKTSLKDDDSGEYNYAYTLNEDYGAVLSGIVGDIDGIEGFDGRDVIAYLSEDDVDVQAFANAVYAQVKDMPADISPEGLTFTAPQGYYLIVEVRSGLSPDSYSLVMLDTMGQENITVSTKEDVPELTKVLVGAEEEKAGDYGLGDTVSFLLTGTMPENIDSYDSYKYVFHDVVDPGFEVQEESVSVKVDGVAAVNPVVALDKEDGCSLEVSFADIKNGNTVTKDSKVTVEYDAEVTEDMAVGRANVNKAHLEFANNPYEAASIDNTPDDKVYMYTYKLVISKQDDKGAALKGANFSLRQKQEDGSYVNIRELEFDGNKTEFEFEHLDAGSYRIVEERVPDGYAKIDDVDFTIDHEFGESEGEGGMTVLMSLSASTDEGSKGSANFTANPENGTVSTIVVNMPGSKLPSTGGSGTTMLYVVGGIVVAAGLCVVVMSRRKKEDKEE